MGFSVCGQGVEGVRIEKDIYINLKTKLCNPVRIELLSPGWGVYRDDGKLVCSTPGYPAFERILNASHVRIVKCGNRGHYLYFLLRDENGKFECYYISDDTKNNSRVYPSRPSVCAAENDVLTFLYDLSSSIFDVIAFILTLPRFLD